MTRLRPDAYWVLMVAAAIVPVIGALVPLAMVPLTAIVVIAVLAAGWPERHSWRVARPLVVLALSVGLWALVSAAWAIDPAQSIKAAVKLTATALIGAVAVAAAAGRGAGADRLLAPLALGMAVGLALLSGDYFTGNGASRFFHLMRDPTAVHLPYKSTFNRGATVMALMAWPLCVLVYRRWGLGAALAAAAILPAVALWGDSLSCKLAIGAGILAFLVALVSSRAATRGLGVLLVVLVVAFPIGAAHLPAPQVTWENWRWLPSSAHHRVTIWGFTGARIAEKPLFGWGMDASRSIPGADEEVLVSRENPHHQLLEPLLPLHPHNALLQWWLELGVPGVALLTALGLWMLRRIETLAVDRVTRAACVATFASAFVVSAVSYGFWQSWWQATMWLAALFCALLVAAPASR